MDKAEYSDLNKIIGLTSAQAAQKVADGQVNTAAVSPTKSIGQIVTSNIFTLFNAINVVVFILVVTTGKLSNTLFMGVIISNIFIGIFQEIKAKKTIDKFSIISAVRARVVRDGAETEIPIDQIVMEDICILSSGDQVSADGEVLSSSEMEVDESLLTGESEPVVKKIGDKVMSGSFIVAGRGVVKINGVGKDSYAQKIISEAQKHKRARSEILETLNKIIKTITFFIVPLGLLLFLSQFFRTGLSWQDAIVNTSAGVIGMIPEGLVILTSIAFAAGMIKLAMRKTVIQELAGIEVLAHVNVLCLDKTGTLTEGSLEVADIIPLENATIEAVEKAIATVVLAFEDKNSTSLALAQRFKEANDWKVEAVVPFSSARKWSGVQFEGEGSYVLGAPEFVFKDAFGEFKTQANEYSAQGYRVMVLAFSEKGFEGNDLPQTLLPQALLLLSDKIRPEARETLDFFSKNDVEIKVISGDNPATVSEVARKLNLKNAEKYVDATTLPEEGEEFVKAASNYTVFGRVTPQQKKRLIAALKSQGNVVAMTGDGVNDVLA